MTYKQLTAADRGTIEVLLHEHYTQVNIAKKLGVDPSQPGNQTKVNSLWLLCHYRPGKVSCFKGEMQEEKEIALF